MQLQTSPGRWVIVAEDATVAFHGRASWFGPPVQARFARVTGAVHVDGPDSAVDVDVDLASMTTGNPAWDEVLSALDPFDVGRHPTGRYRSDRVHLTGGRADVEGTLDLCGRRARVPLAGRYDVLDEQRARLTATGSVDPRCYGLRLELPGARFLMPARLQLSVDVVAARLDDQSRGARARPPHAPAQRRPGRS